MPSYKLTYFPLRGRGEPIRMLLTLAGQEFEEETVPFAEWSEFRKNTPFGHLPVLHVDGKPLGQTLAILRYLAKEYGFYGSTPLECAMVDAVAEQHVDFGFEYGQWHRVNVGYAKGDKDALYRDVYLPARAKHFPLFVKMIRENPSGYLVGSSLTYVDLLVATRMELLEACDPNGAQLYDGFPELKEHRDKVYTDARLAKYLATRPAYPY